MEDFIYQILDGELVRDHQIEFLCRQLDVENNRTLIVEILSQGLHDSNMIISVNGLMILTKLFLMKSTPRRDWKNLSNFIICI